MICCGAFNKKTSKLAMKNDEKRKCVDNGKELWMKSNFLIRRFSYDKGLVALKMIKFFLYIQHQTECANGKIIAYILFTLKLLSSGICLVTGFRHWNCFVTVN